MSARYSPAIFASFAPASSMIAALNAPERIFARKSVSSPTLRGDERLR